MGKFAVFTVYTVLIFLVGSLVLSLYDHATLKPEELGVALLICWFSDATSLVCVEAARRHSEHGFANVWVGMLPRLGGPMMAVVTFSVLDDSESGRRMLDALVFAYLVTLPAAVWTTLPKANRKIDLLQADSAETPEPDQAARS